ncbi:MAG: dienelactone hydrolase family protein [Thermoleophilia bacterium]|nr:dienelactone hydrolase family protein [Thermoleophilia bacterium]
MSRGLDTVDLPVAGGHVLRVRVARPAGAAAGPLVVVLHELFGVNDDMAWALRCLADRGFVAAAPELFHRTAPPGAQFPKDDEGRADAFVHLGELTPEGIVDDVRAVLDARPRLGASGDPAGLLGFSAGGHAAVIAAAALPVCATVAMYPGWLGAPDGPIRASRAALERIADARGRIVVVLGTADHVVGAEERVRVARALAAPGVDGRMIEIDGAGHAFFWPGAPAFDEAARDRAWAEALTELRAPYSPG